MPSFSRMGVWLLVVLAALQIVNGGWTRLRAWVSAKWVGVAPAGAH